MIKSFSDLQVYKKSQDAFRELAPIVKKFPRDANFLGSQLLRAANSIHANIAEGFGRSDAEFKQYLRRALGSANEILSHLDDALAMSAIDKNSHQHLIEIYTVIGKQLYTLRMVWKSAE